MNRVFSDKRVHHSLSLLGGPSFDFKTSLEFGDVSIIDLADCLTDVGSRYDAIHCFPLVPTGRGGGVHSQTIARAAVKRATEILIGDRETGGN